jgi:FAD/FMN-containing dehydrogenase
MNRRLACGLVLAIFLSACSAPPDKERQQAQGALEAARAAGAETYAATELDAAQAALRRYDEAVALRDYRQALNSALEARGMAYEAARQAADRKAELRSQSERLADDLDALVTTAGARLTGRGRVTGAAATRLQRARDAAEAALQEARTRVAQQDYPGAIERLTPAIDGLLKELPATTAPGAGRKS